jgi:hypothetical protein
MVAAPVKSAFRAMPHADEGGNRRSSRAIKSAFRAMPHADAGTELEAPPRALSERACTRGGSCGGCMGWDGAQDGA